MEHNGLMVIYFINKFSPSKTQVTFPISPNMTMIDILPELVKKFNINISNIAISVPSGQVLTQQEYRLPIKTLIERFGQTFEVIDRNVVG